MTTLVHQNPVQTMMGPTMNSLSTTTTSPSANSASGGLDASHFASPEPTRMGHKKNPNTIASSQSLSQAETMNLAILKTLLPLLDRQDQESVITTLRGLSTTTEQSRFLSSLTQHMQNQILQERMQYPRQGPHNQTGPCLASSLDQIGDYFEELGVKTASGARNSDKRTIEGYVDIVRHAQGWHNVRDRFVDPSLLGFDTHLTPYGEVQSKSTCEQVLDQMATRQREKYCLINSSPLYRCAETVKTMWDDINTIDGEDTLHGLIMATREIAQGEASHLPLDWTNDKPLLNAIGFEGTQDPLKNGGLFEVPADGPQRGTWAADTIGNIIGAHSSITESDGNAYLFPSHGEISHDIYNTFMDYEGCTPENHGWTGDNGFYNGQMKGFKVTSEIEGVFGQPGFSSKIVNLERAPERDISPLESDLRNPEFINQKWVAPVTGSTSAKSRASTSMDSLASYIASSAESMAQMSAETDGLLTASDLLSTAIPLAIQDTQGTSSSLDTARVMTGTSA